MKLFVILGFFVLATKAQDINGQLRNWKRLNYVHIFHILIPLDMCMDECKNKDGEDWDT